jgi:hypothetical protein
MKNLPNTPLIILIVIVLFIQVTACDKEESSLYITDTPCQLICYDTLSINQKIAYQRWTVDSTRSLGVDFLLSGEVHFRTDMPAGNMYQSHSGFLPGTSGDAKFMNRSYFAFFSPQHIPLFQSSSESSNNAEVDILKLGENDFQIHEDFKYIISSKYLIGATNGPNFRQVQVTFSEDLKEAFLYEYGLFQEPRSFQIQRYVTATKFIRPRVPPCKCLSDLVNFPES